MIKYDSLRLVHSRALSTTELPLSSFDKSHKYHDFLRLLRPCKSLQSVLQIHGHLLVSGLEKDDFTLAHLLHSYSSFHKLDLARKVFECSINPSAILWNFMIRACTTSKKYDDALELYFKMKKGGVEPDKYTLTFVLKACTGSLNLKHGILIHDTIINKGLESDVFIGTSLIDFYCKLGQISIACELFEKMPQIDTITWNSMISGFSQCKQPLQALNLFRKMQSLGFRPNSISLLNLFPSICQLSSLLLCRALHGFVVRGNFSPTISNGLIDTYSKCGKVEDAYRIFIKMTEKDDVSWASMISGYVHNSHFNSALELFDEMKRKNLKLNQVVSLSALLAVGEERDLTKGLDIHTYLIQNGIANDKLVSTSLITMYAKCGDMDKAQCVFHGSVERDTVTWSAMISALVQGGKPYEALVLFRKMQLTNLKPNRITIVGMLPACAELLNLNLGKSVHCFVLKSDIDLDISIGTALVAVYAKCKAFTIAHTLFDNLQHRDIITWNAMINGYAQIGDGNNALKMFQKLRLTGFQPDPSTIVGALPACVHLEDLEYGMSIHGIIIKSGFGSDLHVQNALLDMYAKCRALCLAESLFKNEEFFKDEISWNIMISGYMQNGQADKAISAFSRMKKDRLCPNLVTIVSVLPAVAYMAALREGTSLHSYVIRIGFQSNTLIENSLIDMYAKCGHLDCSRKVFDGMLIRDTVSWNAMISGYAIHGYGDRAIQLFSYMREKHIDVDSITFVNILSGCRHGGLIDEGKKIFYSMNSVYHLDPSLEHYACMIDLLGRGGHLDEAWNLIQKMPMTPDASVWGSLLGSCRIHSNVLLGERAVEELIKLEPDNPSYFVSLSNIYAQVGRWEDVKKMRTLMNRYGLKKTPGCSWVEVKGFVHAFIVGDTSHPDFENICIFWKNLYEKIEKMGYVPDTSCVLHNIEEEEKESFLCSHSERLAMAFALLNTKDGEAIQIVKNLRVCNDCHMVTKLVSKIVNRRITVRDASRFHHFESGICSCKDYW